MPEVLASVEASVGHVFQNRALLWEALTHSSYAAEQSEPTAWNERLEFLGDAVLELLVSQRLFRMFPDFQEGELTRARALLVNEEATSGYAMALGLQDMLLLGRGENMTGGRMRKALLGDAFEAMLGALYLDGGFEAAAALLEKVLPNQEETSGILAGKENPKSALLEYAQKKWHCKPCYVEVSGAGPIHAPHFVVEVQVHDFIGKGEGGSKKAAEADAARVVLEQIRAQDSVETP